MGIRVYPFLATILLSENETDRVSNSGYRHTNAKAKINIYIMIIIVLSLVVLFISKSSSPSENLVILVIPACNIIRHQDHYETKNRLI